MNQKEKDIKFIKKGKLLIMVFGLLSLVNIIILIGRNQSYALFRRNVQSKRVIEIHTASKFPPEIGVDALKKKLGVGGLIGIPTSCSEENCDPITDKNADKSTIREYRYSGLNVNNYVYFNCKEGVEQNSTNCETWRILGIFKDEEGNEHIKIVKNQVIPESILPETYQANGKSYKIKYDNLSNFAYWNYDGSNYNNNWVDSGLMYWLNSKGTETGYLKSLSDSTQRMIEETKYYLGTITKGDTYFIEDTTVQAYNYERAVSGCSENKGPSINNNQSAVEGNSACRVWANNAATWTGKIALMYPSDYGFSADSEYWNTILGNDLYNGIPSDTSWLQKKANHTLSEWLLSPTSYGIVGVASWNLSGYLDHYGATRGEVRPSLNLKSKTQIIGGNGSLEHPYQLNYTPAVDIVKKTLGITGGIIGVTENNKPTTDKEASNIREYRYSGSKVNNYVYFNCQEGKKQNVDNCETWRIIGIFNDENGQEHIKIVRDKTIAGLEMPLEYIADKT